MEWLDKPDTPDYVLYDLRDVNTVMEQLQGRQEAAGRGKLFNLWLMVKEKFKPDYRVTVDFP